MTVRMIQFTALTGPQKLIAQMEGRGKYVHSLIILMVSVGQSEGICVCIMRACNSHSMHSIRNDTRVSQRAGLEAESPKH